MLWNATEAHYAGLEGGGYVRVRGTTQIYNGQLQMMLKQVQPVVAAEVNEADFRALGRPILRSMRAKFGNAWQPLKIRNCGS